MMRRSRSEGYINVSTSTTPTTTITTSTKTNIDNFNPLCSICKDVLLFPCTLGCGHSFCYRCLKDMHSHVHGGQQHYESESASESESESASSESESDIFTLTSQQLNRNSSNTYRDAFFDEQCFKSVVGSGNTFNNFSSSLLLDTNKLLRHILHDSVFCDNCPALKCPTCRLNVKVLPKPNILLHETLKKLLGDVYEMRIHEYLSTYCEDFILEQYEQSERFKTITLLVSESIQSIQQATSFNNLMGAFSAYGPEEIVWCLNKLGKGGTFIIVKDIIVSNAHYSSDFNKLLESQKVTSDDINYLMVSHPNFSLGDGGQTPTLMRSLKKRFKGVRTGALALMDNEDKLNEAMRQCIITNDLLEW